MISVAGVAFSAIHRLTRILCRIDDSQLARVPHKGPLILVPNHINFLDVPVLYTHLRPRPLTTLAKIETWHNPVLGYLFTRGGAIPVRRGEADVDALREGLHALEKGDILAIAPEGTRSNDGRLKRGKPGVVLMALHSGAPLLPVVFYGPEAFRRNIRRLRRTDFHIIVGQPFRLEPGAGRVTHGARQEMTDEIMYQLAALLPPAYRGYYSDLSAATERYLRFPEGSRSNLLAVAA